MTMVASPQQSKELVASRTAGDRHRVERHGHRRPRAASPRRGAADPKNTVLFVGYQAAGTRGRLLVDGAQAGARSRASEVPVAARIERIDSMSAHADAGEIMRWLSGFSTAAAMTYLVHGEPVALRRPARRSIEIEKHWPVHIAVHLEQVEL